MLMNVFMNHYGYIHDQRQTRRLTNAVPSMFGLSSTVTVLHTRSLNPLLLQNVVHWNEFSQARYSCIA
ncbi:hypothetical protein DERF_010358 [Dermatophagoides farinae]|uniref:Uncharacterized protein n=1 Tax=Dermatophagoides farinae TaxID=6954 RepID=A0A922HX15_DERFA|nr:hypothetical protein DERF_010358 [Dermatophagoides farinae]